MWRKNKVQVSDFSWKLTFGSHATADFWRTVITTTVCGFTDHSGLTQWPLVFLVLCPRLWQIEKFSFNFFIFSTGKSFDADISPKPTIFLPSVAEINHHKAGTYLCLLENFFPYVIKVSWTEEGGNTILESQQADTMRTNDTYMKLSWLTVTEASMYKEHRCIVKHENNRRGVDQVILFPPVERGMYGLM